MKLLGRQSQYKDFVFIFKKKKKTIYTLLAHNKDSFTQKYTTL